MSKKLTFLFIATFIIALVFFSGYFVVREVRGKVVTFENPIDMQGDYRIKNLKNTYAWEEEKKGAVTLNYFLCFDEISFRADADRGLRATNWCQINDFLWCSVGGGGACFTAETQILMADDSYKPIKDVKEGDWILTKENQKSDKMVSAKVVKTFEHTVDSYLVVNNKLKVTDIHPIFVNGMWKQAWTIKLWDKLLNEKGQEVVVESLKFKRGTIKVYNLEIEGYETFFAGGFYVHNKPEPGTPPQEP